MIQRTPQDGLHIMVEGIDGSGKSTVLHACQEWAEKRGVTFFDTVKFSQENHRIAEVTDVGNASGLLSAEPTFAWTGAAIRNEIISKHENESVPRYSGAETAEAFSLDRLVLFRRLIIPFLQNHKDRIVFQDRGFASSLAYQPLQDPSLTTQSLLALSGNAQTIAFAPTILILIRTEAAAAIARLAKRTEKQDNDIFEDKNFQERLAIHFLSDEVLGPFREAGTAIVEIDGNQTPEAVSQTVQTALSTNLPDFGSMRP